MYILIADIFILFLIGYWCTNAQIECYSIAPIYLSTSDIPVVRNTPVFRKTSALSLSMNWSSAGTLWLYSDTSNCIPFYSVQEAAIVVIIVRLNGMTVVIIKWAKDSNMLQSMDELIIAGTSSLSRAIKSIQCLRQHELPHHTWQKPSPCVGKHDVLLI